jgi:UDP-N-acetylglucosamine--N-acetylmuramyl-(pentapeptide) pyrophosphoryl-undecaprenol N-acetylglucosamine transferase
MPNIALINELKERYPDPSQLQILYIGTRRGMERELVAPLGVVYKGIFAGKLRRYFSWENFADLFKLPLGILQSFFALARFRPKAVFCKGGYVCFPVAVAGWMLRIPVILHESDVVPGLANSLSARFASKICISFEETREFLPARKTVFTGNPVRRELMYGNCDDGRGFTELTENLPVILVMGGSQGADFINRIVWDNLDRLLTHYQVVHICGEDNVKGACELVKRLPEKNRGHLSRYRAFSFVGREMKDLYAFADLIVCRSGAITLTEIGFFGKPAILVPLSARVSRGDQIDNARVFAKEHTAKVIEEEDFNKYDFFKAITLLLGRPLGAQGSQGSFVPNDKSFDANEKIIRLLIKE